MVVGGGWGGCRRALRPQEIHRDRQTERVKPVRVRGLREKWGNLISGPSIHGIQKTVVIEASHVEAIVAVNPLIIK